MSVDFLDSLPSGEKDIHAFEESRQARRQRFDIDRFGDVKSTAAGVSELSELDPAGG